MDVVEPVFDELGHFAQTAFDTLVMAFSDPQGALEKALNDIQSNFKYSMEQIGNLIQGVTDLYDAWIGRIKAEERTKNQEEAWAEREAQGWHKIAQYDENGNMTGYVTMHESSAAWKAYEAEKAQAGYDKFGYRGTKQKNRTTGTITYDQYGRIIEDNQKQEVDINLSGNATVTVEGEGVDGKTFKQINKAVVKQATRDSRVLSFAD